MLVAIMSKPAAVTTAAAYEPVIRPIAANTTAMTMPTASPLFSRLDCLAVMNPSLAGRDGFTAEVRIGGKEECPQLGRTWHDR